MSIDHEKHTMLINKDKSDFPNIRNKLTSESTSLILFCVSVICFGISNFHIKYIQKTYPDTYEMFSFIFWRNLFFSLIIYGIIKYKSIEIIDLRHLNTNSKIWLSVRTFIQFASLVFLTLCLENLRVGTANSFIAMNPAVVLILSTLILKEKFHWRYAYGFIICFTGVLLIISNDRSTNSSNSHQNSLKGVIYGIFLLISIALLNVSSKILNNENIGHENQCLYIGLNNLLCALIFCVINKHFSYSVGYLFSIILNSSFYFTATYLIILSLKGVDLIKTTSLNYLSTVSSTFLGILVLNEKIFFTDILGSLIILGFNVYNSLYPAK
jgi:drug/metabolite transporter (DMT)-like permease